LGEKIKCFIPLKKGESIRGKITEDKAASLVAGVLGQEHKPVFSFMNYKEGIWGEIEQNKVSVICVLKDNEFVRDYFSYLTELEYK
jgi:hypothetical protein